MSLRDDVLRILRSGETGRINFSFIAMSGRTIHIDGRSFAAVAAAIESDRIHVDWDNGQWTTTHTAPADARYNSVHNYLLVHPRAQRSSRIFEALVIHECVHAFFDMAPMKLANVDSETASYIAQGCYLRTSGFDRNRLGQAVENEVLTAMLIADGLAHQHVVPQERLNELRSDLRANPNYQRGGYISGMFRGNR